MLWKIIWNCKKVDFPVAYKGADARVALEHTVSTSYPKKMLSGMNCYKKRLINTIVDAEPWKREFYFLLKNRVKRFK